jgi:hypothetical protein
MEFNNAIWKCKKAKGLSLSQELTDTIYAPIELNSLKEDLLAMHRIINISFTTPEKERMKQKLDDEHLN